MEKTIHFRLTSKPQVKFPMWTLVFSSIPFVLYKYFTTSTIYKRGECMFFDYIFIHLFLTNRKMDQTLECICNTINRVPHVMMNSQNSRFKNCFWFCFDSNKFYFFNLFSTFYYSFFILVILNFMIIYHWCHVT